MSDRDAAGISRNGLRADPAKWRDTQRRAAVKYAAKLRASTMKEGKRRRPQSTKRPGDFSAHVRSVVRRRSKGICELDGQRPAIHFHHRKLRRHGDHRIQNALHLCFDCHELVHARRLKVTIAQAEAAGWIVSGNRDPGAIPVQLAGDVLAKLTPDGGYEDLR